MPSGKSLLNYLILKNMEFTIVFLSVFSLNSCRESQTNCIAQIFFGARISRAGRQPGKVVGTGFSKMGSLGSEKALNGCTSNQNQPEQKPNQVKF